MNKSDLAQATKGVPDLTKLQVTGILLFSVLFGCGGPGTTPGVSPEIASIDNAASSTISPLPGGVGGMGWGAPAAVAAKLALPHKRITCLTGDGGFMMSVDVLATCVQYDLPVVFVVSNNSGLGIEEWMRVISVNLTGTFMMARATIPAMLRASGGAMVLISSRAGKTGFAAMGVNPVATKAHYCASKAGVISLTKSLAMELAPYGVRVNGIAPGPFEGTMIPRDQWEEISRRVPFRQQSCAYSTGS